MTGIKHVSRDFVFFVAGAHIGIGPVNRLHANQVDHTLEIFFSTDRQLQRHRGGSQTFFNLFDNAQEISTGAVHLVDKGHARHLVLVCLPPDCFRLRLDTTNGTKNGDCPVEYPQ